MKNMIISIPNEKDLDFFDEVVKEYPEDTKVFRERGFDAAALFRIIVDASVAIAPHFLAALSLFLTYKIEQRKIKQQEQKLDLEREMYIKEKDRKGEEVKRQMESLNEKQMQRLLDKQRFNKDKMHIIIIFIFY